MGKFLLDTAKIFLGTLCMALAVNLVYEPMGMVTGGISGLAIVIKELTGDLVPGGIPVWLSNITINIPIFVLAYFVKGKRFLGYTFLANILFTVFLGTLPVVALQEKDFPGGGYGRLADRNRAGHCLCHGILYRRHRSSGNYPPSLEEGIIRTHDPFFH